MHALNVNESRGAGYGKGSLECVSKELDGTRLDRD
jgi:hypothetical protein